VHFPFLHHRQTPLHVRQARLERVPGTAIESESDGAVFTFGELYAEGLAVTSGFADYLLGNVMMMNIDGVHKRSGSMFNVYGFGRIRYAKRYNRSNTQVPAVVISPRCKNKSCLISSMTKLNIPNRHTGGGPYPAPLKFLDSESRFSQRLIRLWQKLPACPE
jgi:hypothetical protein